MSLVKFGKYKTEDGSTIPLQFGLFQWGQPIKFYILHTMLDYLPQFIERNNLCKAILRAISKLLVDWNNAVLNIKSLKLFGKTGLKYANENWKLFLRKDSTDDIISKYIGRTYKTHCARGTTEGLLDDIKRITYDDNSWYKYYGYEDTGWWLEKTFPEISLEGFTYKYNKLTYLDLDNMLFVEYYNRSPMYAAEIEKIMLNEFIPLNLNTSFLELKPFRVKFGTFKFNRRRFGELRAPKQYLIGSN